MDTRTSPIRMRLTQLREEMARRGIDVLQQSGHGASAKRASGRLRLAALLPPT